MTKDEAHLLQEFDKLVVQCKKNIAGDCPSRDDVIIVFIKEYVNSLKKYIAEQDYKFDIVRTRSLTKEQQSIVVTQQITKENV